MKRPAFQFYPADWRKDMALQSCSVAARGLWMDMLCIAHECEPYGHLTVNGKPMSAAQIGRHTGLTERECIKLVAELEDAGVLSRTDDGAIYSRRMVRDEDIRQRRADGGKAGAEHGIKGKDFGSLGGRGGEFHGPGILYAVQRQSGGPIKIGVTRHLKQRISGLRAKIGEGVVVLGTSNVPDMSAAEQYMLAAFEGRRDGEWISAEWGAVRDALGSSPHPPFQPPPSSSSSSSTTEYPPASLSPPAEAGSRPRALRRCPGDFDAEPLRAWAAIEAPRADFDREAAKFRDHTFRTAHSDWSAALRNWLRRADEDAAKRPQSAQDRREAEAAKWLRPSAVQRDFIDMEAPSNAAPLALR